MRKLLLFIIALLTVTGGFTLKTLNEWDNPKPLENDNGWGTLEWKIIEVFRGDEIGA